MEKNLLKIIKDKGLFSKGERVIVACSGGADSVALLVMLNKIKHSLGIELVVVHVNHNIRGAESDEDAKYVDCLAKSLGLFCVHKSVDAKSFAKESKQTLEQSARELRYKALREAKVEQSADKIAVAHNLGDQTETVLMHLFRGAGVKGVLGMDYISGDIVRPILDYKKSDLIKYLNSLNISFREDSTNVDLNYTRNYIRHKVIDDIEKVYPAVSENIVKFSIKLRELEDFVNSCVPFDLIVREMDGVLIKADAVKLHPVIMKKLIFSALEKMDARVDIEEKHIADLVQLFFQQVGKKISLPNEVVASRTYSGVVLERKQLADFEEQPFSLGEKINTPLGMVNLKAEKKRELDSSKQFIDIDKLPAGAVWRNMQDGDKFAKFSGGTKTVAKFLADKKIDSARRKKMVVLADGDNVLVIPGIEISKSLKITDETKNIVSIELVEKQ